MKNSTKFLRFGLSLVAGQKGKKQIAVSSARVRDLHIVVFEFPKAMRSVEAVHCHMADSD